MNLFKSSINWIDKKCSKTKRQRRRRNWNVYVLAGATVYLCWYIVEQAIVFIPTDRSHPFIIHYANFHFTDECSIFFLPWLVYRKGTFFPLLSWISMLFSLKYQSDSFLLLLPFFISFECKVINFEIVLTWRETRSFNQPETWIEINWCREEERRKNKIK